MNPIRQGFKGSRHHVGPGACSGGDASLTLGAAPSFGQHNDLLPWAELPGMQTGSEVHPGGPQSLVSRSEVLRPVARIGATSPPLYLGAGCHDWEPWCGLFKSDPCARLAVRLWAHSMVSLCCRTLR